MQRLLNASKLEALRELNDTYRLGLDLDTSPSPVRLVPSYHMDAVSFGNLDNIQRFFYHRKIFRHKASLPAAPDTACYAARSTRRKASV